MSKRTRQERRQRRAEFNGNGKPQPIEPEVVETPRIELSADQLSNTALIANGFLPALREDLHNTFSEAAERCSAAVDRLKKLSTAQAEFYEKMAALAEEKHREEVKKFKERGL